MRRVFAKLRGSAPPAAQRSLDRPCGYITNRGDARVVSLGVVAILIAIVLVRTARQRELTRHTAGPRHPWLNEVAVALADLGLTEQARNTGAHLGGTLLEATSAFRTPDSRSS